MDRNGASDPYIIAAHAGKILFKTKVKKNTLNPVWDENFTTNLRMPLEKITFKVKDVIWWLCRLSSQ